jgi:hypothetical protein
VITSGSVITGAKVTEHEVKIELDADVLFDFDKYNLRPEAEYTQDTWRVTRKLTWTFGVRDTFNSNPLNPHDQIARRGGSFSSISQR